jgi:hypothetical protein
MNNGPIEPEVIPVPTPRWRRAAPVVALAALALAGCAGKYPVRGTVTLADGSPLPKGLVVFERVDGGPPLTARGNVGPDGRYELSTDRPGDGVPPGRYKVLVNPLDPSDLPDEQKKLPFDVKYLAFRTSGLECEVPVGPEGFPVRLERPASRPRRGPP